MMFRSHGQGTATGPVDFLYLLRRRKSGFTEWCEAERIVFQQDFEKIREKITFGGEFMISDEMEDLISRLPKIDEPNVNIHNTVKPPSNIPVEPTTAIDSLEVPPSLLVLPNDIQQGPPENILVAPEGWGDGKEESKEFLVPISLSITPEREEEIAEETGQQSIKIKKRNRE